MEQNNRWNLTWFFVAIFVSGWSGHPASSGEPITTPRIESFPKQPVGYQLIDWRRRSTDFVRFALNPIQQGEYLPLMWWDDTQIEARKTTFGLPSYVGMKGQWNVFRNAHEAFVSTGTVVSGTWLGMDMSAYPVPGSTGQTFFYELSPSIFIAPLVDRHRQEEGLSDKWHRSCATWSEVGSHLWRLNNHDFQSYDLQHKHAVVKDWTEPDVMLSQRVVDGKLRVEIGPDDAIVLVLIPDDTPVTKAQGRLVGGDTVVDYAVR